MKNKFAFYVVVLLVLILMCMAIGLFSYITNTQRELKNILSTKTTIPSTITLTPTFTIEPTTSSIIQITNTPTFDHNDCTASGYRLVIAPLNDTYSGYANIGYTDETLRQKVIDTNIPFCFRHNNIPNDTRLSIFANNKTDDGGLICYIYKDDIILVSNKGINNTICTYTIQGE
jgi:hypothetical protein